ncbi:MAG: heme-based aerotactic transducer [Natronomonas sp.]|jgi:heme-based aerotactic transducer
MSETRHSRADFGNGGLNEHVDVDSLVSEIELDREEIEWRKDFIGLDEEDRQRLTTDEGVFRAHADEIEEVASANERQAETISAIDATASRLNSD